MTITKIYKATLSGMILAGLTACGNDRPVEPQVASPGTPVAPPRETQQQIPAATESSPVAGLTAPAAGLQTEEQISESDVIPREYIRDGVATTPLALAKLEPTEGHDTSGLVSFIQTDNGVGIRVTAKLMDLASGSHGFHIHENGDCSAPDASSAGGHFNPTNQPHAGHGAENRHAGDLGNIQAGAHGFASLDIQDDVISFEGVNSIIGKAVVVHSGEDDLSTQPSGDAGERIACGVISMHHIASGTTGFPEQ